VFGLQWALDLSIACHCVGGLVQTTRRRKMAGLDAVTGSGWEEFACSRYILAVARDSWVRDKQDVLPHHIFCVKVHPVHQTLFLAVLSMATSLPWRPSAPAGSDITARPSIQH
jgi:hypothetical protein